MKSLSSFVMFVTAAGLMLAAGSAAAAESICPRFAISSVEQPEVFNVAKYSAVETTDLIIHVVFSSQIEEEHVISLRFLTPEGHLYRQIDVPVAPEVGREGATQTRRLDGYPYPVTVVVPEVHRVDGASVPSIEVQFPVGGTSILSSSLYGEWHVNGMVDGRELRCFRPLTFGIWQ